MKIVSPTAFFERREGGLLLAVSLPADTAVLALEMFDELITGLTLQGDDTRVASSAGALVGLLDDLRVRSFRDAVMAACAGA